MYKGIVGYTITKNKEGVFLSRGFNNQLESIIAKDFDSAVGWLTQDFGEAFSVCWNLNEVAESIFSLLPKDVRERVKKEAKVQVGDTKIFYTGRQLGLTKTNGLHSNFVRRGEINLYSLQHWLPSDTTPPENARDVVKLGEKVVEGLEALELYPESLSSPIGAYCKTELDAVSMPTIYTFREDWLEAMHWCTEMMRDEWREVFKVGYWPMTWDYDLVGAYGSFMRDLPSTDHCVVRKSKEYQKHDWAILKGKAEVWVDVSPLTVNTGDGCINPKGILPRKVFTSDEINWLERRQAGRFTLDEGWVFQFADMHPYREVVDNLFAERQAREGQANFLAKRITQGLSGKLDEDRKDGQWGDFYNPILALMTRSRCRIAVADFLHDNYLEDALIAVNVDGCLCEREAKVSIDHKGIYPMMLPINSGYLGSWRLDATVPALVLGKGEIWREGKKPMGLSFEEVTEAFKKHPDKDLYKIKNRELDLKMMAINTDRKFQSFPQTGGEAMGKVFNSEAVEIK